jgi:hypothetical protein
VSSETTHKAPWRILLWLVLGVVFVIVVINVLSWTLTA